MTTLVEIRAGVKAALAKYEELWSDENRISKDDLKTVFSLIPGYEFQSEASYYERSYIYGPVKDSLDSIGSVETAKAVLKTVKENRLQLIVFSAYLNAIENYSMYGQRGTNVYSTNIRTFHIIMNRDEMHWLEGHSGIQGSNFYCLLQMMNNAVIEKEHLVRATERVDRVVGNAKEIIDRYQSKDTKTGIGKLFESAPNPSDIMIEEQLQTAIKTMPSNGLTARTWGWEIEVPDAMGVTPANNSGIEKGEDGSLRSYNSDSCQCDCRACTYHECNCDNCEDYNDSPDHDCGYDDCSQADMAEFRTTGGIQRLKHSGMYDLLRKLNNEDAEKNDSAGTHIHVWAGDLTTHQVGQVMAIYKYIENIMHPIAGREDVNYSGKVREGDIAAALSRKNPTLRAIKPIAVNVSHLFGDRGTIEFRQMDCNLDSDRITFWAWLVRGLVEIAKRGATLRDFMKVTDLDDVMKVYEVWNYTLQSEGATEIIPGSRTDKALVKLEKHKQVS